MTLIHAMIAAWLAAHAPKLHPVRHPAPVEECDDEDEERMDDTDEECE